MMNTMLLSDGARYVIQRLEANGYEAYAVGGCVRDMLMGLTPNDFDITTNALPKEITEVFASERIIETGLKHGTVTVLYGDEPLEITTYRIEGEYFDNRHPSSVSFTNELGLDLSRRDFTVNAMAYNPKTGVVDLYGGRKDIERKLIRCVGESEERFNEDGLRILRALRFASVLGFKIDTSTEKAIHDKRLLLKNISHERILSELTKLLCGLSPAEIICGFSDVFEVILPQFQAKDIGFIDKLGKDRITRYTALFSSYCDAETAAESLRLLKSDKKLIHSVAALAEHLYSKENAKQLLKALGADQTKRLIEIRREMGIGPNGLGDEVDAVLQSGECYCLAMLALTGKDLISLGFCQNNGIGHILDTMLEKVIRGELENTRDALTEYAISIKNNI